MVSILNKKKTVARIKARTAEIVLGGTYFLSNFYDKEGAMVKVIEKSTKINSAGWPSTVKVEVLEPVGDMSEFSRKYYATGTTHTCNATNLYDKREQADPAKRRAL